MICNFVVFMRVLPGIVALLMLWQSCRTAASQEMPAAVPVDSTAIIAGLIHADLKRQQLDTFFENRFVDGKFSGCVLVAQRGIVLYEKSYGWKDHESRDSLTTECSFQLASVSKQFTAAAIMLLHQQGKLNYDDTVGKYIPGFHWPGVTIRHLLTHRAGLDKYTNICDNYYREVGEEPSAISNTEALSVMGALEVRAFRKPGEKFDYSNTGYMILALVVERISGMPFHAFMKNNFFDPLGMSHTWVATDGKDHPEKTKGYFGKWKCWKENFLDGVTGDKGVYTSAGDLYKWDRELRNGKIFQKKILEEAFTGYSEDLAGKRPWNYGFGWRTLAFDDGASAVFHNGWWHGYTTTFYRGITDDVTIIILCNKFNKGIYNTRPILAMLGAHHLPFDEDAEDNTDSLGGSGVAVKKK
jgi:CubicO group peptidase (beta-lactamase class C family)